MSLRIVTFCVGLMIATGTARADSWADCTQVKDLDLAIQGCTEIITRGPDASAYYNRASAYNTQKKYDRATADYTQAIELNPKDADNYNGRAWNYFEAGKAALGLADAERALEIRPDDPDELDTRGHIYEALGRREEAIADYRGALSKWDAGSQGSRDGLKRLGASP